MDRTENEHAHGEFDSAAVYLSELLQKNENPLRIASVRVEGATQTRSSFLNNLVKPHLTPQATSTHFHEYPTFESVLLTARRISQLLHDADIFHSIDAHIEKSQGPLARDGDVDIVFRTREKGRFFLNTSTEVGNGEGSAKLTARVRNTFGGAEVLEGNLSFGTKTRHSYHALLSAPLTSTLKTRGELAIFELERDNSSFASSYEGLKGIKATIRSGSHDRSLGVHEFAYEAVLRHIRNLSSAASISMREAVGKSLKSSVSHTWIRDTRDDKFMATRGFFAKLFQEFAGLGGQASFYKVEADGQFSRPLIPGAVVSFAARSGFLWGFKQSSMFSDRFQLGGPVSVRSFRVNSLGPRDGFDSLGGDLYWSIGLSIISNIPHKPHWPVKTHLFINAGRLDAIDHRQNLMNDVYNCLARPSISAGLGILYCFDPIRVEANFGVPLIATKGDVTRRGLQIGIGLDFL